MRIDMPRIDMRRIAVVQRLAAVAFAAACAPAGAQDYPSKPVRMIHPYVAGGPAELITRTVSERMAKVLGQPLVVESRPGAAGSIGAELVARAAPDGYTLLVSVNFTLAANPHLYPNLPFDPLKDFAPIIALAGYDSALIMHPSIPASNVQALIAHLKANPGKLNFASAGKGSPGHVLGELFKLKTGVDLVHIPYKGNAPAVQSVVAGESAIMFTPTTVATPLAKAGRLRLLAVYNTERNPDFPDVPTLESEGITGFEQKDLPAWYGWLAPAGTPQPIIAKLNAEANRALREKDIADLLQARGFIPFGGTPEQFGDLIKRSYASWGKVIRDTGINGE
ncbi:MAG: Bug family tripartite tricarboxylate transporter substrate binding protein [Burkholderiales bacterium]